MTYVWREMEYWGLRGTLAGHIQAREGRSEAGQKERGGEAGGLSQHYRWVGSGRTRLGAGVGRKGARRR